MNSVDITVDAFRHYIGREGVIVEGFLGKQNPRLIVGYKNGEVVLLVDKLDSVTMKRKRNFGVDIYLPFSEVKKLTEYFGLLGFTTETNPSPNKVQFNPQGKEQGNKKVPKVIASFGRIGYAFSGTCYSGKVYCSRKGWLYVDIETHDEKDHGTWSTHPRMEAFELHIGIRGVGMQEDPFFPCKECKEHDLIHLTKLNKESAKNLADIFFYMKNFNYAINLKGKGEETEFELTMPNGEIIRKSKYFDKL